MILDALIQHTMREPSRPRMEWQVVRLCVNRISGEWHNVGVVLRDHTGQVHTRMLTNPSGLRCYYGDNLANDAQFLIDQAREAILSDVELPSGWNVRLSEITSLSSCAPIEEMMSALYSRVVPLARSEQEHADKLDTEDHQNATNAVRRQVRELIKRHKAGQLPDFWCKHPIIATRGAKQVRIDVQISGAGQSGMRHGTIASAWYLSNYHRRASIDRAQSAALMAQEVYPQSTNTVYLLQPTIGKLFNQEDMAEIWNDIDTAEFLLTQRGARMKIYENVPDIAHDVLEDMNEL